jgi:hypothetical protein
MLNLRRLHEALDAAGVPHEGVYLNPDGTVGVHIKDSATAEQRQLAADLVAGFPARDARDTAKEAANAEWKRREGLGFTYQGKRIDSDDRSLTRITAASSAAQIATMSAQPFSIEWKCADNTLLTLDAAGMMGMMVAMVQAGNAIFLHAQSLKDQIDAAVDPSSVDVTAGWPE